MVLCNKNSINCFLMKLNEVIYPGVLQLEFILAFCKNSLGTLTLFLGKCVSGVN